MQILLLLGLVVIGASIALIYMQKGDDDKEKGFISKIINSFMGAGNQQKKPQQPAAKTEKYEKSADGKVVYIFKDKADDDAESDNEDDDDSDEEVEDNPNTGIHIVETKVVDDQDESDEAIQENSDSDIEIVDAEIVDDEAETDEE